MTAVKRTPLACGCLLAIMVTGAACKPTPPARPAPKATEQRPESTVDQVCKITAEIMGVQPATVTAATSLDDLQAHELDFVAIVMVIEDQFDVTIPDEAIEETTGTTVVDADLKAVTMAKLAQLVPLGGRVPVK